MSIWWGATLRYPEPKLIPTPPELDTDELRRDHREVMKSEMKLIELYDELLRRYPDQWVGLHHSLGVVHSNTRVGLRKEIQKRNFPRAQTVIEHMETNPKIMIL